MKKETNKYSPLFVLTVLIFLNSCSYSFKELKPVSVADFKSFVDATGYITDAEKYAWSIVQKNVFQFTAIEGADWKRPDGIHKPISMELPVTQVSYNDAMAYCRWSGTRLPSYYEYWKYVKGDKREIVTNYSAPISPIDQVNILGNVWEITSTSNGDSIRLAGGSVFCSEISCNGTSMERVLHVDNETGNIHIGFAVITD